MRSAGEPEGVPDWLWAFDGRQWGWHAKGLRSCGGQIEGRYDALQRWHEACRAWLEGQGLVAWEHNGGSLDDFQRIEREEPHRILRRPSR